MLLEGLSSAAAAQHARSLLRRCCGALPALAEALAGDGALPRLPRLALLHALLEGGGAGWPAEAAEVLRALLRSPEVPCAAAHDAAASAELLRSLRRNGAAPLPRWLPEEDPTCADLALLLAPPLAEEEGEAAGAGGIGALHAGWPLASGRSGDAPPSDEVRVPGQACAAVLGAAAHADRAGAGGGAAAAPLSELLWRVASEPRACVLCAARALAADDGADGAAPAVGAVARAAGWLLRTAAAPPPPRLAAAAAPASVLLQLVSLSPGASRRRWRAA